MAIHHGEILGKAMKAADFTIAQLARKMHWSRNTVYKRLESETIDFIELLRLGKALNYDFEQHIPEIKMYKADFQLNESEEEYLPNTKLVQLQECKESLKFYRNEAYRLSNELVKAKEQYIDALNEISGLRKQLQG